MLVLDARAETAQAAVSRNSLMTVTLPCSAVHSLLLRYWQGCTPSAWPTSVPAWRMASGMLQDAELGWSSWHSCTINMAW